jgi:hypothetical protein
MTHSSRNESTEGWQRPKRTRKINTSTSIEKLELKNSYEFGGSTVDSDDNEMDTTVQEQKDKEKLPSPIIVHGFFKDHLKLTMTTEKHNRKPVHHKVHQVQHKHIHKKQKGLDKASGSLEERWRRLPHLYAQNRQNARLRAQRITSGANTERNSGSSSGRRSRCTGNLHARHQLASIPCHH